MNFTHFDLGNLNKGRVVEVHLTGNAANVFLIDSANLARYKKCSEFQAVGGLMRSTPVRLQTSHTAHWHVIVDLPAGTGSVKSSYRVLNSSDVTITSDKLLNFKPSIAQKRAVSALAMKTPVAKTVSAEPVSKESIVCKMCGREVAGGKFCPDCGTSLDKKCPQCGIIAAATSKFCVECGYSL
ncbi:MAG: DUF1883 domain-containing protein [Defluviitaleaceae bacterium]|nr:DUF1883 domain-containing protein [Defluviitaleaceae bacterium]